MKFWDSSSLLPLLVKGIHTDAAVAAFQEDPELCIWWGTPVECISAMARQNREGRLGHERFVQARGHLRELERISYKILPSESVKTMAEALLLRHPLRAADSLQLGAALVFQEETDTRLPFLSEDKRLCEAAEKEGFTLQMF